MMTKVYCHNGYCEPIYRENEEAHPKTASGVSVMTVAVGVSVSVITFVGAFIGGLLMKFFIF